MNMSQIQIGNIEGVETWEMPIFSDIRGALRKDYVAAIDGTFAREFRIVENFFTVSRKNVFRGLHFQSQPHPLSKIVSIVQGSAIDYLLDLREESPTFLNLFVQPLGNGNDLSIFIPNGVAHGYLSLEENTIMCYKFDEAYCKNCDNGISGEIIKEFIPIDSDTTIKSEKDINLSLTLRQIPTSTCNP
jgi:dTDP-4-dehydrorhamnose 3,5-epimerase/CDP-3, 6-dideoxy-D-glycero-D-glycero-4-hexulose-5-epimerase